MELGVLGPVDARRGGFALDVPKGKPLALLVMLGLHAGEVVSADTLVELLWGDDPPRTAAKALQTHISSLRRTLGDGVVVTRGTGWTLADTVTDTERYLADARAARAAAAAGDPGGALVHFDAALALWRGAPEVPDTQRGLAERTRWIEGRDALVEDRTDALLATGRAAEVVGELEAAVVDAPLRERRWAQLMLALYRAGRQGEALRAYQRARATLTEELGVEPGPELRRLEAAIVAQDPSLEAPQATAAPQVTRTVTFLLTDIEGSTAAWEAQPDPMAVALARHDELTEQVVTSRGGRLVKTRGEGDATFSVFDRPSSAAAAAIELQEAIGTEAWNLAEPIRVRIALHTGEVELRDGDYFGRAVNRAARLRSLAVGGQIVCSRATADLVVDSLPDDVTLADLGERRLRDLARPEHVYELSLSSATAPPTPEEVADVELVTPTTTPPIPAVLTGRGPFVGRAEEIERLTSVWDRAAVGTRAMLIAGEPGVGKTRLAGEWARRAHDSGCLVLYGRCDEDLAAPYQPFAEALRTLVPWAGASVVGTVRGVEALLMLVPELRYLLPDLEAPARGDPDTERYALFDAVTRLLSAVSAATPVMLVLDDLHWATKPTLLLLRHLLRFGESAHLQIVGTYRSTDLDRTHPLSATLDDLHRDGTGERLHLGGLPEADVTAYVAEAGYDDQDLARALASVTAGNPFFLIEALRHVDESGGRWDPGTLPQGVRDAVGRRLSRLPDEANDTLLAAAVVGSRFSVELVEKVLERDVVDALAEAGRAGIVIDEERGRFRFNHAIVRQSLLAELPSVKRVRLHQRIAAVLETAPGADDDRLADLAHHYFESAWAGNAAKAIEYCRRAGDQAMERLAYEGAADLYDRAVHAMDVEERPDTDDERAELLMARCEALLAAGEVNAATGAVEQLSAAAQGSDRLAAWAACFAGQLGLLTHAERLDEIESSVAKAAERLSALGDDAGEAKAHTVHAACLARLGRIADCETSLDRALTAARRAGDQRRVNAVLAGAPVAALWGPNPVPRAGGRCLDVVRLLRITTGSPAVEAISTRCQAVLEAFRGRPGAARRMIESARRALAELGLRHALLEVDLFAGIVEQAAGEFEASEPYLRRAHEGLRRMGLDADTAQAAALLARALLVAGAEDEAEELCAESERLAGHDLKASIAWRTVRAQLCAARGDHDEARVLADAAVARAERTDALVDHGDSCMALATVLRTAGDAAGAAHAAERAASLYERKAAAALVDRARSLTGAAVQTPPETVPTRAATAVENAASRHAVKVAELFAKGDFEACARLHSPHVTLTNRRRVIGGYRLEGLPDLMRDLRAVVDQGMVGFQVTILATRGERTALARIATRAKDPRPGAPSDELLEVLAVDTNGLLETVVLFDPDDIDAAYAELEAQYAAVEGTAHAESRRPLENAATRADDRFCALFKARDWEGLHELHAEAFVIEDRRVGLNTGMRRGRDAEVANVRAIADIGVTETNSNPVAVRGERLSLAHHRFEGNDRRPDAFQSETLCLVEVDKDGLLTARVGFDADDVDAAFAELDARYLAGEAAPYADVWRPIPSGLERLEAAPEETAPDFAYVDHRPASYGSGDMEASISALQAVVPDVRVRVASVPALDAHGAIARLAVGGTSTEGAEVSYQVHTVWVVHDGLTKRVEVFAEDELDAALARFDELRPRVLENAATRIFDESQAAFFARDWVAYGPLWAPDAVCDVRRPGMRETYRGRDELVAGSMAIHEVGLDRLEQHVVAIRGDRLCLFTSRYIYRPDGSDPFVNETVVVFEVDPNGLISSTVMFDIEEIDAAYAELEGRYLAGEAKPHADVWSVLAAGSDAKALAEYASDVIFVDHRKASFGPSDLGSALRVMRELVPDVRYRAIAVHALDSHGAVVRTEFEGTVDGFEATWSHVTVNIVRDGAVARIEAFDPDDLDAALARFVELGRRRWPETVAVRGAERSNAAFNSRSREAYRDIFAPDVGFEDRRRGLRAEVRGAEANVANAVVSWSAGDVRFEHEVVAVRGEHLVLIRVQLAGRQKDSFQSEMLAVGQFNTSEQEERLVTFDADDLDGAYAELERLYLEGEAARHADVWRLIVDRYEAFNRRDFTDASPATIIDRRPHALAHEVSPGFVHGIVEDVPDARYSIAVVHRLAGHGAVVTYLVEGETVEGFEASWHTISVYQVVDGRVTCLELFGDDDLDTALARFDELR